MKKSQKILIGAGASVLALAAVAAIAGPLVYREFLVPPAADAPSLSGSEQIMGEPSSGPLDPATLAGEWQVGADSEAGYRVNEVLNGTDVTVTGRTPEVTGTFQIGADGLTLEEATLSVDVASISTDSAQRDSYFRDQALRASEFPDATFVLTEPVTLKSAPGSGETVRATATGDLTIAGETRSTTADVEVRSDGTTAEIAGSIPITFADFGVTAPNLGFVSVEPDGFVEFQLTASPGT
ncbi:polyisoprenoid-binding protein YceI [Leucobacter luti]|uniref:YceI family protein n=1 Tax=Leucobacter luti TaxID=340320 RepID=UPI00104BD790|nr:YceI family protein [Leucobacter luti]MCW2288898.1 polyisoprenoid-binding protein YceI [Leucobacter luti]TCK44950.1 polyisoprenoid-binding protein YceI [Leucobacter luti]